MIPWYVSLVLFLVFLNLVAVINSKKVLLQIVYCVVLCLQISGCVVVLNTVVWSVFVIIMMKNFVSFIG